MPNPSDQILNRLWELATLSHEAARGSIAGQMKALAMIVAIEGLIPDRRLSRSATRPAAPPVEANIYEAEWLRKQQNQAAGEEPGDPVAVTEAQPAAPPEPKPAPKPEPAAVPAPKSANRSSFPNLDRNQTSPLNPFINTPGTNWVPAATGNIFDAFLDKAGSLRLPYVSERGRRCR